jgi:polysaccharide export outer membrane protein
MIRNKTLLFGIIFTSVLLLSSCTSRKNIAYYQNIEQLNDQTQQTYEPRLQADDLLSIIVNSETPELTKPYNLYMPSGLERPDFVSVTAQQRLQTYLVDNQGYINFPVLGKLKLGGLTRAEAEGLLTDELKSSIKDVSISLRILNFKISVQGEVLRPAVHNITTERVTLPEALSMSGDLTIYGKRDNILIIREVDGKKSYNYVDITKSDFINSPFYYLSQNDLVYVEPNKTKVNSSVVGPNISVILSALSVLASVVSVIAIVTR